MNQNLGITTWFACFAEEELIPEKIKQKAFLSRISRFTEVLQL